MLEEMIHELVSRVSEEMEVDSKYHSAIIGTKGVKIRELSDTCGADIKITKESNIIIISGGRKNVDKAKAAITKIVQEIDAEKANQLSKTVSIASRYHPGLRTYVRTHSNTIKARVLFPKEGDDVIIRGSQEEIDNTEVLLMENLEESVTVKVPRDLHRFIRTKEFNEKYGVYVRLPSRDSTTDNVVLVGKKATIHEAEAAFGALVVEAEAKSKAPTPSNPSQENRVTETINFNNEFIGRVIGRNGSNLRNISDISGCRVDLDKKSSTIAITGTREGVAFAIKQFQEIFAEMESHRQETMKIDPRFQNRLAGPRFANILKIQEDFGVTIKMPKDGDVLTVGGNRSDVQMAMEYIGELLKEIKLEDAFKETSFRPQKDEPPKAKESSSSSSAPPARGGKRNNQSTLNDPFFAPPPAKPSNLDKTSVWGAKMN